MIRRSYKSFLLGLVLTNSVIFAAYSDQFFTWPDANTLWDEVASSTNVVNADGQIQLAANALSGSITFNPVQSDEPFNIALASWNGFSPVNQGGFRVFLRFPWGTGWSPWLEVGFWQNNYWTGSKSTTYGGGYIDIDTAILYNDRDQWQAKVEFQRDNTSIQSPAIHRFSVQVSDQATTDELNIAAIVTDNPPAIFYPAQFTYQNSVDPDVGGSICSPTTTAMILSSFGHIVNVLEFAWETYDPYYHIFGVWPRAVQSASRYEVSGYVNRYRTWSEAYETLAAGGRIAMSIGQPLYSGHLLMLAGFDNSGRPIVHDPARSNGYGYVYNKTSISQAWFDKGGVAYTFFPESATDTKETAIQTQPSNFEVSKIFPNPFNASTRMTIQLATDATVSIQIFSINGQLVDSHELGLLKSGAHTWTFDAAQLSSGIYSCQFKFRTADNQDQFLTRKISLVR